MLPGGGITIGVCGRAPGPIAGEGIAICTCPDEGLGAKPAPAGIVWPCGGIADTWGIRGGAEAWADEGRRAGGSGTGIGITGIMPCRITGTGGPCGVCGPTLGMRICGLWGKTGGARGVIEGGWRRCPQSGPGPDPVARLRASLA
jgi:hypothetical protein